VSTRTITSARVGTLPAIHPGDVLRRVPRAAWICALVACLNAVCWSIVTPAFQVPDEPDHFAYVKQLAETGGLPSSNAEQTSVEETLGLIGLRYYQVRQQPENRTIASQAEQRTLQQDLTKASQTGEKGSAAAGVATAQPPLYYALEAIPYSIARGGTLLDRLQLMRLLSALMAGLTALFVFLFIREALPAERWAWTVGGLAVALAPLLGFISGAVNPDALLFAVSAAIFYCLARAFRRGLSTGGAVAIGSLTAIGFLTKLNFIGLAPGVLLGLLVLAIRAARVSGRSAYRSLALATGIGFSPVVLFVAINALSNHPSLGLVSSAIDSTHGSVLADINYIWQFYLPRLPGTVNDFPGLFTTRQLWFDGYVGLYGWLDTTFPGWVYNVALIPAGAIALLCVRALFESRGVLRSRAAELGVYAVIAIGVMVLTGADSYRSFPLHTAEYAEPRYMLPMLALFGAMLALAARGAGRRWGPIVGTLIVVLFLAHDIFSQLLVVARFYG
jgi:4-amino-4-deoxy-L-arabinose transferase-like glycosyltransferase